jgi:hypothetical protein
MLKLPQEAWGYFYANLDPGPAAFSPVRNINDKPSEGFSLAADERGNVTACWLSDKLCANVSHDDGETFAPFVELNPRYNLEWQLYGRDGRPSGEPGGARSPGNGPPGVVSKDGRFILFR